MSNEAMPKVGEVVAGKYVIEQVIGEGGMGAVFAATHKLTGKRVALKWMLPALAREADAVQRFMREAQAAGRINHPNVVDVYDVGQHDDSFFLVMELLTGEPLTAAIERRDLTPGEIIDLLLPAMRGVAAAHRGGVVHRDLKPDNVFLCRHEDGRRVPKVLDFGISKVSSPEGQVNPRLTRTGAVVGTPYYMSPEQIRGSHDVDKRADIYAFGVILYEALTGQVPFNAETYGALILEIATGTAQDPHALSPAVTPELSSVVLKAIAREAADRFPDIESFAAALEPFAATAPYSGQRDPTGTHRTGSKVSAVTTPFASEAPPAPPRAAGGSRALLAAAAGLLVGGAAWWLLRTAPAEQANATHVVVPAAASAAPATAPVTAAPVTAVPIAPSEPGSGAPAATPKLPEPAAPAAPSEAVLAAPAAPALERAPADPTADQADERSERVRKRRERVPPKAEPAATPRPVDPAAPRPRAPRSGTLSVDDF